MLRSFDSTHKRLLREAVVIGEEVTSDYYKLSRHQWRQARYDILTLPELWQEEISSHALAQVTKYICWRPGRILNSAQYNLYRICLQDHNILKALEENTKLALLPLLIYVVTHELVHVIRFGHFHQHFEASAEEKAREENMVHCLTQEILSSLKLPHLGEVLQYYKHNPEFLNS